MVELAEQAENRVLDFYRYPSVGAEDWRYTFATGQVRVLFSQMLTRAALSDLANADSFESAVDLLSSGEYGLGQGARTLADVEKVLLKTREQTRQIFTELMIDKPLADILRARENFANMRLALRRKLTERSLGSDYSNDGSIPAEQFEEIFEVEDYSPLPLYMREAIEQAVLAYYKDKDIRQIDYALDAEHAGYKLKQARELKNVFLCGLFRMQIDLTNIRTMFRLKFAESESAGVFFDGGYIEKELLKHCLDTGYEALGTLFFSTPYYEIVEHGANYLVSNKSFLKLEQLCEGHLAGFLRTTFQITAGAQPLIAYLLMKENEIRMVRLILTAKNNGLDTKLILDRIGE